jgi:hypothetical protein
LVTPEGATVSVRDSLQLTATVTGTANQTVTWTVTANSGTVSESGLYTAPSKAGMYTVTAISQADSAQTGKAVITVQSGGASGVIQ